MLSNKPDSILLGDLKKLVTTERRILSDVICHLEEVNRRKLYVELGYRSLVKYCVGELRYSESAAYRRIKTLKLSKSVPSLMGDIKRGAINLSQSTVAQKLFDGRKVDPKKQIEIIKEIKNKSAKKSEDIIREMLDLPKRKCFFSIEVKDKTLEKWNEVKARFAHLDLTDEALFNRIMDMAVSSVYALKRGNDLFSNKLSGFKSSNPRYISKNLRREVYDRAGNKCERCCGVYSLEIEHIKPVGVGGKAELENLMLLCKACNIRSAIKFYGLEKMKNYV
tara:strand:+ start:87635 stop:88471 length:837 start_codon:yes stop_codon:yes gene_type:complete